LLPLLSVSPNPVRQNGRKNLGNVSNLIFFGKMGSSVVVADNVSDCALQCPPRERRIKSSLKLRYTSLVMFTIFYSSKYTDMMDIYCTDCRTVNPKNDQMSAEHLHNSEIILIHLSSGVCNVACSYKRQVLTLLNKVSFKRMPVYGYVSCALTGA